MNLENMIMNLKNSSIIELKEIANKLSEIILSTGHKLNAEIKWNRLTFALNGDFHHWICAIDILKNNVSLIFHFGGLLADEKRVLISGSSKFFRKLSFSKLEEVDENIVNDFVNKAIKKLPYFIENWEKINKEG